MMSFPASSRRMSRPSIPTTSRANLSWVTSQLIKSTFGSARLQEACVTFKQPAGSPLKSLRSPEPSDAMTRSTPAFK
jgi:hypothetical protein